MASIGLPGFSGFIAELQVLIGTWQSFPWMSCVAGLGILIGIAFSWRALQAAFFGDAAKTATPEHVFPPITFPERLGAYLLIVSTIVTGLYPRLLMDLILPSLNSALFEGLRRGASR
jgi:NADH-quinone oxidoreductase subunit M